MNSPPMELRFAAAGPGKAADNGGEDHGEPVR
jgi:hypothetical protein